MVLGTAESKWEKQQLADPTVVKVGDTFYMYYEAAGEFKPRKGETPIEYNCSVFLATSRDGRRWTKWPNNTDPQPIIPGPEENKRPGRRRYGKGQPSVCYKNGKFVLHYVDSVAWPDVMVRVESPDPTFRKDVTTASGLTNPAGFTQPIPRGTVSKFAQTDICWLGDSWYLVRPVYGTDRLAILRSDSGVFWCDDLTNDHLLAPRQIAVHDPRGVDYRGRLYPRFLRDPHGQIIGDQTHMTVFYGSGQHGPGWTAYTWDIHRADLVFAVPLEATASTLTPNPSP